MYLRECGEVPNLSLMSTSELKENYARASRAPNMFSDNISSAAGTPYSAERVFTPLDANILGSPQFSKEDEEKNEEIPLLTGDRVINL